MADLIDPGTLRAELKQDELRPVYLLAGADTFRSERTARWMRERVVEGDESGLNADNLWADETTPARIAETAAAFPMFGGRRFLWVRHAEQLPTGAAIEPLLRYMERPSETTILVMTSQSLDKRLKLTKACAQAGRVVEFARLSGRDLPGQVARQAKGHGLQLDPEAIGVLTDLVGDDLAEIDQELAKLALQPESGQGALGAGRVRELVGRSRDVDAFELADGLDPGRPRDFLHGWSEQRRRGGDVYGAGAILAWRLRQLAMLREGLEAGMDAREAGSIAGLSPWQQRRVIPLARGHTAVGLEKTLEGFRRADRRAKSSSLGAELAYDLAVIRWAIDGAA